MSPETNAMFWGPYFVALMSVRVVNPRSYGPCLHMLLPRLPVVVSWLRMVPRRSLTPLAGVNSHDTLTHASPRGHSYLLSREVMVCMPRPQQLRQVAMRHASPRGHRNLMSGEVMVCMLRTQQLRHVAMTHASPGGHSYLPSREAMLCMLRPQVLRQVAMIHAKHDCTGTYCREK